MAQDKLNVLFYCMLLLSHCFLFLYFPSVKHLSQVTPKECYCFSSIFLQNSSWVQWTHDELWMQLAGWYITPLSWKFPSVEQQKDRSVYFLKHLDTSAENTSSRILSSYQMAHRQHYTPLPQAVVPEMFFSLKTSNRCGVLNHRNAQTLTR